MQNVPNIVRDRLKVASPVSHPDADTLTAFSERSLADAERAAVMEHLAQCGECREVVALALPETETFLPTLGSPGSRWLAWPTLRWAFVAAGVAIVSVGLVKYQGSREVAYAPTANKASTQQQDRAKTNQAPAAVTRPQPAQDRDTVTTALIAKEEAPPAAPGPEKARTSASNMKQFHGSGFGAAGGGPLVSNQISGRQWQQQNTVQNQVVVSGPPSGNATSQDAGASGAVVLPYPGAPLNTQLAKNQPVPALSGSSAGLAVDKAKLPVPQASPAYDTLSRQSAKQSAQDQVRKLSPQGAPGQIGGYVVDPSGAVVSNARITITPSQSGGATTAITNSQGAWLIAGLPSGSYRAEAEAPGFKTTILDLNYDANQPSMFSFTLSPGNVSETVEVSSAQVQAQSAANEGAEMKPAVSASEARVLDMEQLAAVSPARLRWSISAAGTLQRSFDQGNTWQDVSVSGARMTYDQRDLDVSSSAQAAKDAKAARAKTKFAGKKDSSHPVFRAVIANGSDVWVGGLNGSLYHSTDSGNHWTQIAPSSAGAALTGDIVSIDFPDPQHGKLSTSTSEIWVTSDSGQTWLKQ